MTLHDLFGECSRRLDTSLIDVQTHETVRSGRPGAQESDLACCCDADPVSGLSYS